MGIFYVTTYIHHAISTEIVAFLETIHRHAYVLPPQKSYTIIYDKLAASQEQPVIETLTLAVSTYFQCTALTICNYDDDILKLSIYAQGQAIPATASPLATVFDKQKHLSRIELCLRETSKNAGERHKQLAFLLALPFKYAQFDFTELLEADKDIGNTPPFGVKVARRKLLQSFDDDRIIKPFQLERELGKLIRQNKIISAVSLYQQHTGATFKQARQHVEALRQKRDGI